MKGVLENGVLRRYGEEGLGDIGTGEWFVREHDLKCVRNYISQ